MSRARPRMTHKFIENVPVTDICLLVNRIGPEFLFNLNQRMKWAQFRAFSRHLWLDTRSAKSNYFPSIWLMWWLRGYHIGVVTQSIWLVSGPVRFEVLGVLSWLLACDWAFLLFIKTHWVITIYFKMSRWLLFISVVLKVILNWFLDQRFCQR